MLRGGSKTSANSPKKFGDQNYTNFVAYLYWELTAIFFILISVCGTVFLAPGAVGSGVPETMGILNGVNMDNTI